MNGGGGGTFTWRAQQQLQRRLSLSQQRHQHRCLISPQWLKWEVTHFHILIDRLQYVSTVGSSCALLRTSGSTHLERLLCGDLERLRRRSLSRDLERSRSLRRLSRSREDERDRRLSVNHKTTPAVCYSCQEDFRCFFRICQFISDISNGQVFVQKELIAFIKHKN